MREQTILSENLKKLRKAHNLTQQQLADILKIKRSTYAYYEHGINPGNENIKKIADIFKISTHELVYRPIELLSGINRSIDVSGILKDPGTRIFPPNGPKTTRMSFGDLDYDEKSFICNLRLLPINYKDKLYKELLSMIEKLDD